jgi:hypothetical protein
VLSHPHPDPSTCITLHNVQGGCLSIQRNYHMDAAAKPAEYPRYNTILKRRNKSIHHWDSESSRSSGPSLKSIPSSLPSAHHLSVSMSHEDHSGAWHLIASIHLSKGINPPAHHQSSNGNRAAYVYIMFLFLPCQKKRARKGKSPDPARSWDAIKKRDQDPVPV